MRIIAERSIPGTHATFRRRLGAAVAQSAWLMAAWAGSAWSVAPSTPAGEATDAATTLTPVLIVPVATPTPVVIRPVRRGETPTTPTPTATPAPQPRPTPARTARPAAGPTTRTQTAARTQTDDATATARQRAVGAAFERALQAPPDAAALAQLRTLVLAHPDAPQTGPALARIGSICEALGDWFEASLAYEAAAGRLTDADAVRTARLRAAAGAQRAGDWARAAALWAEVLSRYPELAASPAVRYGQAMALTALGDRDGAEAAWQALAELPDGGDRQPVEGEEAPPPMQQRLLGWALARELRGDAEGARALYERLVADYRGAPEADRARLRLKDLAEAPAP